MTQETEEKLEEFFGVLEGAPDRFLLLDYDGTLAPFRVDRFKARPWAGVQFLLKRIQQQQRTRMAVITGRPAAEIAQLLGLDPALEVWGLHGAERLFPDGRRELEEESEATRARLDELREQLRRDSFGGLVEEKANGVVMHWRGIAPHKAKLVEQRTRALFEPLAQLDDLSLLEFESGLELRTGRHKGGAVDAILEEATAEAPVAFLGDDLTDELAFQAVNATIRPHLSVLVRREPRATAANIWLRPPEELLRFLERWARVSDQ